MNPLETNPQLFCNGKFKALVDERDVYPILGVIANTSLYLEDAMLEDTYCIRIKRCQLIARPISDMTDEEWEQWNDTLKTDWGGDDIETKETLLYLLSIGVYPFDQSHFETGIVIDSTTL